MVGTVLCLEGGLAVLHPIPFSSEHNMYFEADPYTGFRLKPYNCSFVGNGIPVDVNGNGHRDVETPIARRAGAERILVLGDSFSVGADVRQDEAYPQVLERALNARAKRPVEVVNTGVGGWEPFMYAQYYEHYGRAFHPDLVLVGFFVGNDTNDQSTSVQQIATAILGRRVSREAAEQDVMLSARVFLIEHSHLARLLLQKGPVMEDVSRTDCADFSADFLAIQRARLANHLPRDAHQLALGANALRQLSRIKALTDADGTALLVLLLPDETQINPLLQGQLVSADAQGRDDFAMPQSMLTEILDAAGIRRFDLRTAFLADPRCLYSNSTHWTAEGHAVAAAAIAARLGPVP